MKNIRLFATLLIALGSLAIANAQETISLNGDWLFWVPDTAKVDASLKQKHIVKVPHTYNVMDGLEDYAGTAFYSRILPITKEMKGNHIRICFNAVYHDAIIFVNGRKVGEHLNAGYTPFSYDITNYVNFGQENEIVVECNNIYTDKNLPWKRKFDWANDGGIYRDVAMHISGKQTLRYVHVTPQINLADSTAIARFDIKLFEPAKKTTAVLKIKEKTTGRIVFEGSENLRLQKDGTFKWNIDCGKVRLWHFDDPNLYTFDMKVFDDQNLSDSKTEDFGFRTFTIEGDHFVLNGEPVRLPGLEDMPGSNPDFGMAESHEYMAKTVSAMKDLNCTITRFHWAQDDYRIHLMDSLGMLVQEEISWWQGPYDGLTTSLLETAKQQLTELIEAHYNHPSIYAWGMSNEVGDNRKDLKIMAEHTRSLDNTRIVDAVCNHLWRELEDDPSLTLDLPTWNEYIGTWHANHRDQLAGYFKDVEKVLNGRPVFITEHGLCEPAHTGGDARRVDEMIFHISEWQKHPYVCGYIYFCLEDYRTQMGEEGFGKDRIRRHGVTDKRLQPKASYYILKQIMNPIDVTVVKPAGQSENTGTLANLYDIDSNNHATEITIKVKDNIPSYIMRGYKVKYLDANGSQAVLELPNLNPGQEHTFVLTDINKSFKFDIVRADNTIAYQY